MQIFGYDNNFSKKYNTQFSAIKSIKYKGLYAKHPQLANNLEKAFKNNAKAMDFCNNYDVDIVFTASKECFNSVQSSIFIYFDNITKSKTKKILEKLLRRNNDRIVINSRGQKYSRPWGREYSLSLSLEKSTEELINKMLPKEQINDNLHHETLDNEIELVENKIRMILEKNNLK